MNSTPYGISLIVATVNRTDELARFLGSLRPVSDLPVEVIIVDQNRDDRVVDLLRSLSIPETITVQHLIFDQSNQSLARNYGLSQARYELVAFPDDDCWYEPTTLTNAVDSFRSQPDTAVVLGRWIEHPKSIPNQSMPVKASSILTFRAVPASAIVQFFRRSVLSTIIRFDPRFGVYQEHGGYFGCGEETDLLLTIAKQGHVVRYDAAIQVHHRFNPKRFDDLGRQFVFARHRARGTGGLYAKHRIEPFVVARGIISPLVRSILCLFTPDKFVTQSGILIGRVEGFLRWRSLYGI